MADGATVQASCGNSRTIPISSALHQGRRRLITLVVDEVIGLDPSVTLNGAAATAFV